MISLAYDTVVIIKKTISNIKKAIGYSKFTSDVYVILISLNIQFKSNEYSKFVYLNWTDIFI